MNIALRRFAAIAAFFLATVSYSLAQSSTSKGDQANSQGQLFVDVLPEEAYIWIDGKPASHRSTMFDLPMGEHTVYVYNFGYVPKSQTVTVSRAYQEVTAHLKPVAGRVKGPWGRIQIEGVPGNALVFLNGTSPEFFVGHADEMNNNFVFKQQLIVPPGTHQLYVVRRSTNQPIWSGPVEVKENKRLIVYVKGSNQPKMVYKDWSDGQKIKELKRFDAGTASATIAVPPVTGKLAVDRQEIKCNEPVKLSWSSAEAGVTTVTANGEKLMQGASGELAVDPKQTTKYTLQAAGPGGIVTQDATVAVDPKVEASLNASTQDLRYVKVGDTVQEQGSADLQWSAQNADSVTLDPVGPMNGNTGTTNVQASPKQNAPGPVDETQTYRLTATNVCGGSDKKTVALHVTGSIEPEQVAQAEPPPEPTPAPQLPKTGSPLPLLALSGVVSFGWGLLLKLKR